MRTLSLGAAALLLFMLAPGANADVFSIEIPGLEAVYGDAEPTYHESAFDFGMTFDSVDFMWLELRGTTEAPRSYLTFTPEFDDVPSATFMNFVGSGEFLVDLVVSFDDGILDGAGTMGLTLITENTNPNLSSTVTSAVLYVDGVPEPATLTVLAVGTLFLARRKA